MLLPLTVANLKMMIRNRQAIFWALTFPLIFVVVFGFFANNQTNTITIGFVDYAKDQVSDQLIARLVQTETFKVSAWDNERQAIKAIEDGDLGYLLVIPKSLASILVEDTPVPVRLIYDDSNLDSALIIANVRQFLYQMDLDLAGVPNRLTLSVKSISARELSYFDFLVPGLAIWGVMSFSVIGLATMIASYKEKQILKRILATPLKPMIFLMSQAFNYLVMSLVQTTIILGVAVVMFGFSIAGNLLYITLLVSVGNILFLNLGLIIGSYSKTVQAASGIGNAVVVPLMFFSGVFFPTDSLPTVMQKLVNFMPLAPLLTAMRGVTLEAKAIWEFPAELAILLVWIGATALVANRVFRFH